MCLFLTNQNSPLTVIYLHKDSCILDPSLNSKEEKKRIINSSKTGINFLPFTHGVMSRKHSNNSRSDRRIFTLNLTIERKTLEHATWRSFVVSYTIHILGEHSIVTSMHSRMVYSMFCFTIFTQTEALSQNHFNYKYLHICVMQYLGPTGRYLIRPLTFRRVCKVSKSGN